MAVMSPFLSWSLFLAVIGAIWYVQSRKNQPPNRTAVDTKARNAFLNVESESETGDVKKKQKVKKKKPSPAVPAASKEVVSTDDGASNVEDVAEEVDPVEAAKRFQSSRNGGGIAKSSSSRPSRQTNLAPASPFATASQTSSTGADADIDEEDTTPLAEPNYLPKSSSIDPTVDMLEESTAGPGVLKITAATQPRLQSKKKKSASPATEAGVHASKNAKKKEKARAEKEADRKAQAERFEQHRKAQRAADAAQAKSKPSQPAPPSVWTQSAERAAAPASTAPMTSSNTTGLLDTFAPAPDSSEEDRANQMKSTTLDDSMWEDIPAGVAGPEPEWNEVKRRGRKERKAPSTSGEDEAKSRQGSTSLKNTERPTVQKTQSSKSGSGSNTFSALDTGDKTSVAGSVTSSESKHTSSDADWSAVENWGVE